jgi:hypothetical protein
VDNQSVGKIPSGYFPIRDYFILTAADFRKMTFPTDSTTALQRTPSAIFYNSANPLALFTTSFTAPRAALIKQDEDSVEKSSIIRLGIKFLGEQIDLA